MADPPDAAPPVGAGRGRGIAVAPAAEAAPPKGGKRGGKKGKGEKGAKACYKCGNDGHVARDCPASSEGGKKGKGKGKGKDRCERDAVGEEAAAAAVAAAADAAPPAGGKGGKRGGKKGKGEKGGKRGGKKGGKRQRGEGAPDDDDDDDDERLPHVRSSSVMDRTATDLSDDTPDVARDTGDISGHTEHAQEMIRDLCSGTYECIICFNAIKSRAPTWSCNTCYAVFHLHCAKQWGQKSTGGFRCPQCTSDVPNVPRRYHCFCGKKVDPEDDAYNTPHSCGETCKKRRGGCPHPCRMQCHPGPCPPCTEVAVEKCFCGREEFQARCGEYPDGKSCGAPCHKLLPCGVHRCQRPCHKGECGACPIEFKQRCLCGKVEEIRPCTGAEETKIDGTDVPATFTCKAKCKKMRDCGKHECGLPCHTGPCPPCPLKPENVTTCPCGKTSLRILTAKVRTSCTDPIATCNKPCGKHDSCEVHGCQLKCHEGECPPCKAQVAIQCRCKATVQRLQCSKVIQEDEEVPEGKLWPPRCTRRCGVMKSCGRHKCNEVCCPNKGPHQCMEICRRKLDCGKHHCEDRCHPGACRPCHHIIVDELTCCCGAERLEPPLPCGTEPPKCTRPCTIPQPCGHPAAPHECHLGDCPLCTVRVERMCVGGHTEIVGPCHIRNPTCSATCGKMLPCGRHRCQKKCHAGECPAKHREEGASCGGVCGAELPCGHPCDLECHDENTPCQQLCKMKVPMKCKCGRITKDVPCHKYEARVQALSGKRGGMGRVVPELDCDGDCAHEKRLESMRSAFGVKNEEDRDTSGGLVKMAEVVYTLSAWKLLSQHGDAYVKTIERQLADFLICVDQSIILPAMGEEKRRAYHLLSPFYHLSCATLDAERGEKTVQLTKSHQTHLPKPLLSQWRGDPMEICQDRATEYPESVIIVTDPPNVTDFALMKQLKPFVGRWIGYQKSAREYLIVFMHASDCPAVLSHLRRSGIPGKFELYSEYASTGPTHASSRTTVSTGGAAFRRAAASGSAPAASSSSGPWGAARRNAPSPTNRAAPVELAKNPWEALGRKK